MALPIVRAYRKTARAVFTRVTFLIVVLIIVRFLGLNAEKRRWGKDAD